MLSECREIGEDEGNLGGRVGPQATELAGKVEGLARDRRHDADHGHQSEDGTCEEGKSGMRQGPKAEDEQNARNPSSRQPGNPRGAGDTSRIAASPSFGLQE